MQLVKGYGSFIGMGVAYIKIIGLLLLSLIIGVGSSCLLPPPVEGEPELDASVSGNSPPRIVLGSVEPQSSVLHISADDLPLTLKIGDIEEKDHDDTLFVRWFVNYDAESGNTGVEQIASIDKSSEDLRPGMELTLLAIDTSPTVVEAIVADRPFSQDETLEPLNRAFDPDDTEVADVETDSYNWIIYLDE